jgi:hypothetical protein
MSGDGAPTLYVDATGARVAIIASRWHTEVMDGLIAGAEAALADAKVTDVTLVRSAGSFELPILWSGRVTTQPGAVSGWHHHDRNESSLYVVRGVLRLREGEAGASSGRAGAGGLGWARRAPAPSHGAGGAARRRGSSSWRRAGRQRTASDDRGGT